MDVAIVKRCVICGKPLMGGDSSSEHIIPNAIGGILKDSGIYCKTCNSKFGSEQDKEFTSMFALFMDQLDIRKERETKGTSYSGIMFDTKGNQYHVKWKDNHTVEIKRQDGKYVGRNLPKDIKILNTVYYYNFNNESFKSGLSKIAFNYAVHCGIDTANMERLFDNKNKKFVDNPLIIPFVPMTPFDAIMESYEPDMLFHALRLFNTESFLFAYIELFSTFQFYVLISERCSKNIDESYSNYIEKKKKENDTDLLKELTPHDYKDACAIMTQYCISKDDVSKEVDILLSKEPEKDRSFFVLEAVGKLALQEWRKRNNYTCRYGDVVNNLYDSISFVDKFKSIMDADELGIGNNDVNKEEAIDNTSEFMNSFQFFTDYEKDCVNIRNYKRYTPDEKSYPKSINEMLLKREDIVNYTYMKIHMLEQRMGIK